MRNILLAFSAMCSFGFNFKTRTALQPKNPALRHQIGGLRRSGIRRPLTINDPTGAPQMAFGKAWIRAGRIVGHSSTTQARLLLGAGPAWL